MGVVTDLSLPLAAALGQAQARARLLVVDDQPLNIQVMHRLFSADHQVFMATSGEQALTMCRRSPPDLILLDVTMPEMDGYEVCARLKADDATRNIPVIFVTAHDSPDEETRGLAAGAVDFISKPVNPQVVRARVRTHLTLKQQADLLRRMAFIDGLTGVCNRRYFNERLLSEWQRACRNRTAISLAIVDVDHFKAYNDHYGHQGGDACLINVAQGLASMLHRPADMLARYGGEEFACLLPETDAEGAAEVAARLSEGIRALNLPHAASGTAPTVTVSVGMATAQPRGDSGPATLVTLADEQLYRAKTSGRARACCSVLEDAPAEAGTPSP